MPETIIYEAFGPTFQSWTISLPQKVRNGGDTVVSKVLGKAAKILAVAGALLLTVSFTPSLWYWANGSAQGAISELLYETAANQPSTINNKQSLASQGPGQQLAEAYQPRFDASLPAETTLKIASIGVDTQIYEATRENFEEALKKGVWRASDAGTPFNRTEPTILAAHRFGYLAWNNLFRRESSFYNLPKLAVGDTVEITYKQRKYVYEVYAEGKGEGITDYSADLILYTCEDLTSPVRIFKYARLLEV